MMDRKRAAAAAPSNRSGRHETTTPNTCRFFQLPNALIFDILSRLPIIDLLRCKCVCKSLLCFVSDHEFACLHLSRSPLCALFFTRPIEKASMRLQLAHVDADGAKFQVSELNFAPKYNITCDTLNANACNGLLLFHQKGGNFYVCNLILDEFIMIQAAYKGRHRSYIWGLGYSTVTNRYKVLQTYYTVEHGTRSATAEIYTIGTSSWRSIGNAPTNNVFPHSNVFLNGSLHWYSVSPGEFIHSFGFDTEQFGRVPLPDHFLNEKQYVYTPRIGVIGGCLLMIRPTNSMQLNIWVMKEYGVKESWTNQFVIEDLWRDGCFRYYPMAVSSNGEMLILYSRKAIVCYNQKRKQLEATKSFQTQSLFVPVAYTPSFVSLYNVAKGEKISRLHRAKVYYKICKEKFLRV